MAENIPTLKELSDDILADLKSALGITVAFFGRIFLVPFSGVLGAKFKLLYLQLSKVQKNMFIDTAESVEVGGTLERIGEIKLGRKPFKAAPGSYLVDITGSIGATIDANTTFKSNDDSTSPGKLYTLDADYILVAEADQITLRALEGGLDSKLEVGDKLTATAPILNVDREAVVNTETIEPKAAEELEDYREKGLLAYRLESQGGATTDYKLWSLDAQGVARTYSYVKQGFINHIAHYVEATTVDSIDGKGTPSLLLLQDVEAVVEFDPDVTRPPEERGRRPMTVIIDFLPINVRGIDIEIVGFVDFTLDKQTAILNTITTAIGDIRPFVAGSDILADRNDIISINIIISLILKAIPGSIFDDVILKVDTVVVPTHTFILGDIPHLNSIDYV